MPPYNQPISQGNAGRAFTSHEWRDYVRPDSSRDIISCSTLFIRSVSSRATSTVPSFFYPESTVSSLRTCNGTNTFPTVERMAKGSSADGIYVHTSGMHMRDSDTLCVTSAVNVRRANTGESHRAFAEEISTISTHRTAPMEESTSCAMHTIETSACPAPHQACHSYELGGHHQACQRPQLSQRPQRSQRRPHRPQSSTPVSTVNGGVSKK